MSSVTKIDLATVTLCDALDLAVLVEEESRDRYVDFSEQLGSHATPEAAAFFKTMAGYEEKHRTDLLAQRKAQFGDAPVRVRREQLWDVEAPAHEEAAAFMTVREALLTALRAEQKANQFFTEACAVATNAEAKRLFAELAEEEAEHESMVQAQIARLAPDEPFRVEDFADEPTAQD